MSSQRHTRRISWNAIKRAIEPKRAPPTTAGRLRFREVITWQGRCPAFRPLDERDERRGRMTHHAD